MKIENYTENASDIDKESHLNLLIKKLEEGELIGGKFSKKFCTSIRGRLEEEIPYLFPNDILTLKNNFYIIGRLSEINAKIYGECGLLRLQLEHTTFTLLSDNKNLIDRFAILRCEGYEENLKYGSWVACVQAALRDDFDFIKKQVTINLKRDKSKSVLQDALFYEGLIEGDVEKMTLAINSLGTKFHKRRNDEPFIKDILSIPALCYAKLAWIKGYELEFDNPLIPQELLPITPNESYLEYDFMKQDKFKC